MSLLRLLPSLDGSVSHLNDASPNPTLSTLRASSGNNTVDNGDHLYGGYLTANVESGKFVWLFRGILLFNTSVIPDNASITSVNLTVRPVFVNVGLGNDNVYIVSSNPNSTSSLVVTDYAQAKFGTTSLGTKAVNTFTAETDGSITLNPTGVASVNISGITKLGLILGWDFNNSFTGAWAGFGQTGLGIYSSRSDYSPTLDVTFDLPSFDTLEDNFDDNSIDATKWLTTYGPGGNAEEVDGRAKITVSTGASSELNHFYSKDAYDLTASSVQIEVVQPLSFSETYFEIYDVYNRKHDFLKQGNTLYFATSGGTTTATAFDSNLHRFWRFREASGTLYWETSSDGAGWTIRHSASTTAVPVDSMYVRFGGWTAGGTSGVILFDNFNYDYFVPSIILTGTSSMLTVPHVKYYPSITLTGTSTISALGVALADQRLIDKTYLYKVYDQSNNFLGIWDDVTSDLTYDQEVNSAGSTIQIDLARNSDSRSIELEALLTTSGENLTTQDSNNIVAGYESKNKIGPGSNVDVNYRLEVWVFYGEVTELSTTSGEIITTEGDEPIMANFGAVNGLRKFNGYITKYISRYGGEETTQVSAASFGRELDHYVLESGSNTTVAYSSTDPSNILKDALDKFTVAGGLVDYDATSVELTSTVVTYTFRLNTYLEVIKKCIELAPYDWYWHVGLGDDTVYFADKPTTASHTFILGKHISGLNLEYSIEDITNVVYFTGGEVSADVNLFKKYTDSASITAYRRGLQRISDNRVTLDASATLISEAEIDRDSAPRYRTELTILDRVYDIESVMLGQLVTFRNFGNYIDDLSLQIVGLTYQPNKVILQLDKLLPSVNKRVEDLRRNLIEAENQQTPTAPS